MKSLTSVEAKFRRSKTKAELTMLWKDVPNDLKALILNELVLSRSEIPIIVFYQNICYWWVLTTLTMFIFQNNKIQSFNLSEIDRVELKKLFDGEVSKEECSSLQLFIKNQYFDLKIEQKAWPITYEILAFVTSK